MARDMPSVQDGHGHCLSIGPRSFACLASSKSASVNEYCKIIMFSLRFSGPLKVKATPKRAVRVGKTQSAYEGMINVMFDSFYVSLRTMSTPRAIHTKRSRSNIMYHSFVHIVIALPSAKPMPMEYRGPV
jgi:hypothetical protein